MPRGKWIDKKSAQHFTLVHRPQNDPLIHDDTAPTMVLNPTAAPNSSKTRNLSDLASELGSQTSQIRDNEGEAAEYGVYFDDTEYDYMQHLRDLGSGGGSGDVVFVEAEASKNKGKQKQKQSLDAALRQLDQDYQTEKEGGTLLDEDILPSKNLQRLTYQAQQDIPDAIGGFQPDMDPSLREVLEALEDEAYVENDDEDVFGELTKDGQELDRREFDQEQFWDDEEDAGWETDDTAKPAKEFKNGADAEDDEERDMVPELVSTAGGAKAGGGDWMEEFKQFKKDQKNGGPKVPGVPSQSDFTTTTNGGRRKKRKGALTNPSSYSMTSSSLVRTEQLGILDARFDKMEEQYNADFDDMGSVSEVSGVSGVSGMSSTSSVQGPLRSDFDGIMDEFLGGYSMHGKKTVKKGGWKNGMEQLDEIRKDLGPARIPSKYLKGRK